MSRKVKLLLIVFLSLPELFGLGAWAVGSYQDHRNEETTKRHLHYIQLAIERYAVDSSFIEYPISLEALTARGYLEQLPENPYRHRPMQEKIPGEAAGPGDFTYVVRMEELFPGYNAAVAYALIGYGKPGKRHWEPWVGDAQKVVSAEFDNPEIDWQRECITLLNGDGKPTDAYRRRQLVRDLQGLPRESLN